MDYKKRKEKYLDKLKKTLSYARTKIDVGLSETQNDNSLCFNESHQQYAEPNKPNDLLAKVKRYNEANPLSHISKNRLTIKTGLHQNAGFQSNTQNRNDLNTAYASGTVQNLENIISFIKSKQTLENYKPDTKMKFGPPNATSTIKYQRTHSLKKNYLPTVRRNKKCDVGENIYLSDSVCASSSKIIRSEMKSANISSDKELNNNKCTSTNIEEKAKLNLTYCKYLEFVHSHRDEIICINEKVYPNNDYSKYLKKRFQEIKLKYQNIQNVNAVSSDSISKCSNFIFKPVISLPYSPDKSPSQFSRDSFIYSSLQSISTSDMSLDSSLEKSIQKLNNNVESNLENSEVCFRYYRRKMF